MSDAKQMIVGAFSSKILGVRNYRSLKKEFFVSDFLDLKKLDAFLEEVAYGESDITPAGKEFLEKIYGLQKLPDLIINSLPTDVRDERRKRIISNIACLESPMETIAFIEQARGNIGEKYSLREDLLPPKESTYMEDAKVSAYGGLFHVTKKQYSLIQSIVFAALLILFVLSYIYDMDRLLFGSARITIAIVALLEIAESIYILRKFK